MIVTMRRVFVAVRQADADRLLGVLRDAGVVHLEPVRPGEAVPDEETVTAIGRLARAIQLLGSVRPAGSAPEQPAADTAAEVLQIHRSSLERRTRLEALHRQIEHQALWGDVRLEQFDQLRAAGVEPQFYTVPAKAIDEVRAEFVCRLADLPAGRVLVAVIQRQGEVTLPQGAAPLPLPQADRAAILAEAAELDALLAKDTERLAALARTVPHLEAALRAMHQQAEYTVAGRGALSDTGVFALQGWVPEELAAAMSDVLAEEGLEAAVHSREVGPDDRPPTLLHPPWWAKPMDSLFRFLGIVPGYHEFDVSWVFMIALPIFASMLIGDAVYGLVFVLAPLVFFRKLRPIVGPQMLYLFIVLGVFAIAWGLLSSSFLGVSAEDIAKHGGVFSPVGDFLGRFQVLVVSLDKEPQDLLKRISFIMAAIHLSLAHFWKAKILWPNLKCLAQVGWGVFLWGVFGLVNTLLLGDPFGWETPYPYLLAAGGFLAVVFAAPSWNIPKALALGLATSVFPAIATLSDTISYVRLMALCLTGSLLAAIFNGLAAQVGASLPPLSYVFEGLIIALGHGLNIGLVLVALIAHGVRLNILEFSSNFGMEWNGYSYKPFSTNVEEH